MIQLRATALGADREGAGNEQGEGDQGALRRRERVPQGG
jgi:hypothetical protein